MVAQANKTSKNTTNEIEKMLDITKKRNSLWKTAKKAPVAAIPNRAETRWSSTAKCRSPCLHQNGASGVTVTLTFDLSISTSNRFICVPNYTEPNL